MNKRVFTTMAGLAALAIASTASAQTNIIRITGSTAFRAATHTAISHVLNPGFVYGYSGTSSNGASIAEYRGSTIGDNLPVDIKTSWAGSVGGVATLVNNATISTWLAATNLTAAGTQNETGPYDAPVTADVTMSDSFQGSTAFTSPTLNDQTVGVVPFVWVRNNGSPSAITNMTSLLAQALLSNGRVRLSQFTGVEADATPVLAVGRDADSGTRLCAFADSGFGVFSLPVQYQVDISAGAVTNVEFYPPQTINGDFYDYGQGGYSGGGSVASALNATNSSSVVNPGLTISNGCWMVGYLGVNDASGVNGNNNLTYNGVAYSTNAVAEGTYTFWAYEHLMYRSSLAGDQKTVADKIATQIKNTDASVSGILLPLMKVSRTVEGGVVTR